MDAFIEKLDLQKLGFTGTVHKSEGRPPYAPGVLLKLYLYGYLNKIRSSRKLEKECSRNIELQWLLQGLQTQKMGYKNVKKEVICDKLLNNEINPERLSVAMTPNVQGFMLLGYLLSSCPQPLLNL